MARDRRQAQCADQYRPGQSARIRRGDLDDRCARADRQRDRRRCAPARRRRRPHVPRIVAVRSGDTYQGRRLDRPEDARRQRGARHRRAAGLRRPARPAAAARQPRRHLGARGTLSLLRSIRAASHSPRTRPDTPSKAPGASSATSSRAGSTGPGMIDAPRRDALEAALAVIRLVADQDDQPMALGGRILERARDQRLADAALAKRPARPSAARAAAPWLSPMRIGDSRTEPTSSVPIRAVNDRSRRCATCSRSR